MKEESNVKSYYTSSDLYKDSLLYNKQANYLKLFSPVKDDAYPSYSYDEVFGYTSPFESTVSDFEAGDYNIITPLSITSGNLEGSIENENIDPKITGLLKIMENDPSLKGKFRITSIYRKGATTALGRSSWHGKGLAADIVATSGNFEELEKLMMLNTQLVSYCLKHGLGILDEYTKEGLKRPTGSTGPHMHIGPDKLARVDFLKLLKKYGYA